MAGLMNRNIVVFSIFLKYELFYYYYYGLATATILLLLLLLTILSSIVTLVVLLLTKLCVYSSVHFLHPKHLNITALVRMQGSSQDCSYNFIRGCLFVN